MTPHDRRRLRTTWRAVIGGLLLGVVGAVAIALVGGSGRAGLAVLLVLTSAGLVVGALLTAVLAMVDEYRRVAVARTRTIVAIALFVGGGVLLLMSSGAAGAMAMRPPLHGGPATEVVGSA